ncbi:serine hydrolase [Paenibacillus sp. 1011MAR3C5]|uniref:serine hydrolase domain-containing protein n=1 Tax=Paenibacillus sp. 1011MAR3C5 TaxID=1675787 RepID=UPI0016014088|nr:serine hydrolase domain-containing protein [Paenibacillus sp. 1011MAR3C5]
MMILKTSKILFLSIFIWFAAISYLAEASAAPSQKINEETLAQISDYVREQFDHNRVIGGAVGIIHKDRLIYSEGFGVADRGRNDTPTEKTVYFSASITKALTATAILQLHEQGKLDIDKPVHTYIPWFQFQHSDRSLKVTLNHLLTHSAGGIGSFQTDGLVFAHKDAKDSLESYVRQFSKIRLSEEPGQSGNYCNGCYDVLGLVIEYVSGMSYYDYMQQNIFEPLGMKDTKFGPSLDQFDETRLATEYTWFLTRKLPIKRSFEEFGRAQDPDGGAYSTIEDLGKFISFQLGHANQQLLTPLSMENTRIGYVATELGDAEYTASGFEVKELQQTKVYYKTGDGIGSSTVILFIPNHDLGIALMIGEMHPEIQLPVAEGIASILMGYAPETTDFPLTFMKLIGIFSIALILLSVLLIGLFIRRGLRRKLHSRSILRLCLSLLVWGAVAASLWLLILTVRPSAMGVYGYPYDLAMGIGLITIVSNLWLGYYFLVLINFIRDRYNRGNI